jgi:integrase family protein with SAM-like domain
MTTTTTTTALVPGYLDMTRLAVASFLARYREPTLTAYTQDLKTFLGWCRTYDREVLRISRGELEMYVRYLEGCGYASATVARRFGTVATFYKYAVIDGAIPTDPATAVTRPKVAWEGQKRTVLHPLEFAALLAAARTSGPNDHALVCLLGMLGLRVSEACGTNITDLRYEAGYELLHVLGKGAKPADIPLPSRCSAPSGKPSAGASPARSCGPAPAGGWTALAPAGHSQESPTLPGSPTRSAPTASAALSAPPDWSPASASATCNTQCVTPTPAPRCATTWRRPTSTATPPMRWPPTSPA